MSKQVRRRPTQKRRPQQRKGRTAVAARTAKKGNDRTWWIVAAIVVAVGGALVFVFASSSNKNKITSIADKPAPAALVKKVTGVSTDVIDKVGQGAVKTLPKKALTGAPLVTGDGKPRIVYVGAEYCPYCATERWALVQALSRFGTFKNLQITTSGAAPEPFADTSTFSFHGATYSSPYFKFESVEQQTNTKQPLETPTKEQAALLATYDVAPYTNNPGAIPFVDFGNRYILSGASYDAAVLSGLTHDQIATAMSDPSSDISQGAVGAANAITATICKITDDKPSACKVTAVKQIEAKLG